VHDPDLDQVGALSGDDFAAIAELDRFGGSLADGTNGGRQILPTKGRAIASGVPTLARPFHLRPSAVMREEPGPRTPDSVDF
jgi:hypothetical protein